jgi:hypothetical protein
MMLAAVEKDALYKKADHRLKARGAPYFGICEKDLLNLRNEFDHFKKVWVTHIEQANKNFTFLQHAPKEIASHRERLQNQEFHSVALVNLLVEKGLITHQEIQSFIDETTFQSFGLSKTNAPAVAGDTVVLGFVLSCAGQIVDDKRDAKMAYLVGSADMPIDEHIEGALAGDEKTVIFVWPADRPFEGLEGKEVSMILMIKDVRRKTAALQPLAESA